MSFMPRWKCKLNLTRTSSWQTDFPDLPRKAKRGHDKHAAPTESMRMSVVNFVPRFTFDWILLIAFKRVGVAISQLVKFNLQDLQLMNNIEENIAATPQIHSGREQSDSGCGITIHNQRPLRFFKTNGLDHTWKLKSRHFVLIYTGASMVGF